MTADIEAKTRHYSVIYHDVLEAIPTANAVCLYLILLKFADNKTKTAHPSRSTLAKMMGYKSPQVADKAVEVLSSLGLVEVFARYRDEDGAISKVRDERFRERTSNGYIVYDQLMQTQKNEGGLYVHTVDPPTSTRSTPIRVDGEELIPKRTNTQGNLECAVPDLFDEFWQAFPRKDGKKPARRAWGEAIKRADPVEIIKSARAYADLCRSRGTHRTKVKMAQGWLNDDRFEDELTPDPAPAVSSWLSVVGSDVIEGEIVKEIE